MIYFAAQCPSCGHIQGGSTKVMYKATFTCQKCNKSTKVYNGSGRKIRILCTGTHPKLVENYLKEYKIRNAK